MLTYYCKQKTGVVISKLHYHNDFNYIVFSSKYATSTWSATHVLSTTGAIHNCPYCPYRRRRTRHLSSISTLVIIRCFWNTPSIHRQRNWSLANLYYYIPRSWDLVVTRPVFDTVILCQPKEQRHGLRSLIIQSKSFKSRLS